MAFTMKIRGGPPSSFLADHRCLRCDYVWEMSLPTEAEHNQPHECPACQSWFKHRHTDTERTYMMNAQPVTIVRGNHDFAERQNKRLYERSNDHYRREGRDEAIERQRDVFESVGSTSDDAVAKVT